MNKEDLDKSMKKKMNRSMAKMIYKRVLLVLLIITITIPTAYFSWTKIRPAFFLTPSRIEAPSQEDDSKMFSSLLQTLVPLVHSSFSYLSETPYSNQTITDCNFNIVLQLRSDIDIYSNVPDASMDRLIEASFRYGKAQVHGLKTSMNQKSFQPEPNGYCQNPEEVISEVQTLPKNVYIGATLSFSKPLNGDEMIRLIHQYPDIHFVWAATDLSTQQIEGFPLEQLTHLVMSKESYDKYPHLNTNVNHLKDGETLKAYYLSMLEMLKDYPDFLDAFKDLLPENSLNMESRIQKANDNFQIYGVRIVTQAKYLENLSNDTNINGINIQNMKFSLH